MKTTLLHLTGQLESIYNGHPWYGDSLLQKLEPIGPEEAFTEVLPGTHTIAQITAHILTWRRVLSEYLKGNAAYYDNIGPEQDWPANTALQAKGWKTILAELADNQRELASLLAPCSDELLDRVYTKTYTYRFLIEGIIQHDVYHTGQIGLLISAIKNKA